MSIRIHDPIKIHFYVRLFCIVLFPCSKCNSDVVNDAINNSWCGFLSRKIEIVIVDEFNIQSKYDRYNGTKCMFWVENIVNWAVFLFQRMFSSISSMIVRIALLSQFTYVKPIYKTSICYFIRRCNSNRPLNNII